jgi:hypothetical protein
VLLTGGWLPALRFVYTVKNVCDNALRFLRLTLSFIMLRPSMQRALRVSCTPPTPYLTYSLLTTVQNLLSSSLTLRRDKLERLPRGKYVPTCISSVSLPMRDNYVSFICPAIRCKTRRELIDNDKHSSLF